MRKMKPSGVEWIGDIPQEWEIKKIKRCFNVISGATPKSEVSENWDGDIPWITPADYKTQDKYVSKGRKNLSKIGYDSCGTTIVPKGSIVFSKRAPVGTVALTSNELCTNQGCLSCICLDSGRTNTTYYYYVMSVFTEQFELVSTGTTFKEIAVDVFSNFLLPCPSFQYQSLIAEFLDRKCAEIDSIIGKTKATVEEYKALKQSVITQAVTKGIRPDRPMKDSGVEWIGDIPQEWEIRKLFRAIDKIGDIDHSMPESVDNGIPYLMTGDLLPLTSFIDFDTCKQISIKDYDRLSSKIKPETGDVIFARYATIGTVCYVDVTNAFLVSYSCLTIKPIKRILNGKFLFYYLKSQTFFEDIQQFIKSNTQSNVGLDSMSKVKIILPSMSEQQTIIDYLDHKCAEIDRLIAAKEQLLTELEDYKKSVIYEYVTGKKEVSQSNQMITMAVFPYPYFPADINTKKKRFAQAVLMCKVLDIVGGHNGRVKLEKILFIIENHIGFDFETSYIREAAGPLDKSLYECEGIISKRNVWFTIKQSEKGVYYKPTDNKDAYTRYYHKYFDNYNSEITRIITALKDMTTEKAEILATLYGVWNDFLIQHRAFTYVDIVDEVWNNWNESKRRISKENWLKGIYQLIELNLVPKGYGKMTQKKGVD